MAGHNGRSCVHNAVTARRAACRRRSVAGPGATPSRATDSSRRNTASGSVENSARKPVASSRRRNRARGALRGRPPARGGNTRASRRRVRGRRRWPPALPDQQVAVLPGPVVQKAPDGREESGGLVQALGRCIRSGWSFWRSAISRRSRNPPGSPPHRARDETACRATWRGARGFRRRCARRYCRPCLSNRPASSRRAAPPRRNRRPARAGRSA